MVDFKKINKFLKNSFEIQGTHTIDPHTGVVNVIGDVIFKNYLKQLPVHFQTVRGNFNCSNNGLISLKGAPRLVTGYFYCSLNKLVTLTGAPSKVGGSFICNDNKLISLEGAPLHVSKIFNCCHNPLVSLNGAPEQVEVCMELSYDSHLPLLKLCGYNDFYIYSCPKVVKDILTKYKNTGRAGALKAAAELVREGYTENARW